MLTAEQRATIRRCTTDEAAFNEICELLETDRAQEVIDSQSDLVCRYLPDTTLTFVNAAYCRAYGYPRKDLLGRSFLELIPADHIDFTHRWIKDLLASEDDQHTHEIETTDADGRSIWRQWTDQLIRDSEGNVTEIQATGRDITRLKRAEDDLLHERNRAQQYLDTVSVILVALDEAGTIQMINRAGSELLRRSEADLLEENWFETCVPDVEREHDRFTHAMMFAGATDFQSTSAIVKRSGETRTIRWTQTPIREGGRVTGVLKSGEDITERLTAEQALDDTLTLLQQVMKAVPDIIYVYDLQEGRNIFSNDGMTRILGYSPDEIQAFGNEVLKTLVHPDDYVSVPLHLDRVRRTQDDEMHTLLYRMRHKDGSWRWLNSREWVFQRDKDGFAKQLLGVAQDITEQKQAQDELKQREMLLTLYLESAPVGIIRTAIAPYHVEINSATEQFLGYSRYTLAKLPAENLRRLITYPEDMAREEAEIGKIRAGEQDSYRIEKRFLTAEGQVVWGDVMCFSMLGEDQETLYSMSIIQDITARKRAERDLRESEALYRRLVRNLPNTAVFVYDDNLRFILVETSEGMEFPIQHEQVEGRTLDEVFHDENRAMFLPYHLRTLEGERLTVTFDRDGRYFNSHFIPLPDEDGIISRAMVVVIEVTEERRAQEREIALKMEQERIGILINFIQKASHEFRTPLSIISSSAYLMNRLGDQEKRDVHHERINQQVQALSTLIDSLTLMAELDSKITYAQYEIRMCSLVEQTVARLKDSESYQGQIINLNAAHDTIIRNGDPELLNIAISNLIENALRYTEPHDTITVYCRRNAAQLVLEIRDTGIGIEEEHLPHIFERFYRVDAMHTTRGFGLGLPVARKIIELHGGEIEVESQVGVGSVFRVILPENANVARVPFSASSVK